MINSMILAIWISGQRLAGILIALVLSLWAAFLFFRSSVSGRPPLYSKGILQRILHFIAGALFVALAFAAVAMLIKE